MFIQNRNFKKLKVIPYKSLFKCYLLTELLLTSSVLAAWALALPGGVSPEVLPLAEWTRLWQQHLIINAGGGARCGSQVSSEVKALSHLVCV